MKTASHIIFLVFFFCLVLFVTQKLILLWVPARLHQTEMVA